MALTTCPKCEARIVVTPSSAGTIIRCATCQAAVRLPLAGCAPRYQLISLVCYLVFGLGALAVALAILMAIIMIFVPASTDDRYIVMKTLILFMGGCLMILGGELALCLRDIARNTWQSRHYLEILAHRLPQSQSDNQ